MSITLGFWAFAFSILTSATSYAEASFWSRMSVVGWGTLYSFLLHYILLLADKKTLLKNRLTYVFLYIPSALNIYMFGIAPYFNHQESNLIRMTAGWVHISTHTFADLFFQSYYLLFSLMGLMVLWNWKKKSKDKYAKNTAIVITCGFFASIILGSLTDTFLREKFQEQTPQLGIIIAAVSMASIFYSIKKNGTMLPRLDEEKIQLDQLLSKKNRRVFYSVLSIVFIIGSMAYLLLDLLINQKEIGYLLRFSGFLLFLGMIIYLLPLSSDNTRRQDFVLSLLLACIMPALYFHYDPYGYNNVIWTVPFFLIILTAIFNNCQYTMIGMLKEDDLLAYLELFKNNPLTDTQKAFLLSAKRGEFLLNVDNKNRLRVWIRATELEREMMGES